MKRRLWVLALVSLASACSWNTDVRNAWVRLPAAPGGPAAAYFDVTAESGGTTVLDLEGPFEDAALKNPDGQTLEGLSLNSGEKARLLPGGPYFALTGLSPGIRAGGTVEMRLIEDSGSGPKIITAFSARIVGDKEPPPYRD